MFKRCKDSRGLSRVLHKQFLHFFVYKTTFPSLLCVAFSCDMAGSGCGAIRCFPTALFGPGSVQLFVTCINLEVFGDEVLKARSPLSLLSRHLQGVFNVHVFLVFEGTAPRSLNLRSPRALP